MNIRRILKEEAAYMEAKKLDDKKLRRCIFNPVDNNGFIKQCYGTKIVQLNFTNRRIADPALLDLPSEIMISSVPWGYVGI